MRTEQQIRSEQREVATMAGELRREASVMFGQRRADRVAALERLDARLAGLHGELVALEEQTWVCGDLVTGQDTHTSKEDAIAKSQRLRAIGRSAVVYPFGFFGSTSEAECNAFPLGAPSGVKARARLFGAV